jgi:glycerol uptake facilitator-like aquaporin
MAVAWVALSVSVGQLLVGILALRSPKGEPPHPPRVTHLAANRQSLNAMLLAAVALMIASTALLKVEASNDAVASLEVLRRDPDSIYPQDLLEPWVQRLLVVVGASAALICVLLAQRAWRGWSGSTPVVIGVALSGLMAMAAGVVGVCLLSGMDPGS